MWFSVRPRALDFAQEAPARFENMGVAPVAPEVVFEVLAADTWDEWYPDFIAAEWPNDGVRGAGVVREVKLRTMRVRERFLAWEPGKRLSFTVEASSLPLLKGMLEDIRLERAPDGSTRVHWNVYYEPNLLTRAIHPAARVVFGSLFRIAVRNLCEYSAKRQARAV